MRRVRRWLFLAALSTPLGLNVGCSSGSGTSGSGGSGQVSTAPKEIGSALYTKQPMPAVATAQPGQDPLVIANAIVSYGEKQTVPAQVDAYLEFIGTKL